MPGDVLDSLVAIQGSPSHRQSGSSCRWIVVTTCLVAVSWIFPPLSTAACRPPQEKHAEVRNGRLILEWSRSARATAYHVELRSQVPNGRILARHSVLVHEPPLSVPKSLSGYRAKVSVRLTAICNGERSEESLSWFSVDAPLKCATGRLEELAHALKDGHLINGKETGNGPHFVSGRVFCEGVGSEASYRIRAPN